MVIHIDGLLIDFDDLGEKHAINIVVEIFTVILNVVTTDNIGINRNNHQSHPNTMIGCTDTSQVIGIGCQCLKKKTCISFPQRHH